MYPTAGERYSSPLEFHIALSRAIGIWPYYSAVNYFYFFIYIYFSKYLLPLSPLSVYLLQILFVNGWIKPVGFFLQKYAKLQSCD